MLPIFIDKNPLNAAHFTFLNTVETDRHVNSESVNGLPVQGQNTFCIVLFLNDLNGAQSSKDHYILSI